jgi:hypothetical protein
VNPMSACLQASAEAFRLVHSVGEEPPSANWPPIIWVGSLTIDAANAMQGATLEAQASPLAKRCAAARTILLVPSEQLAGAFVQLPTAKNSAAWISVVKLNPGRTSRRSATQPAPGFRIGLVCPVPRAGHTVGDLGKVTDLTGCVCLMPFQAIAPAGLCVAALG